MIRAKAYKYSAMTMLLTAVVYFIIIQLTKRPLAEDGVSAFLITMLGVAVFAIYSINVMNLALAILFLMILVSIGIKYVMNRRAVEDD